MPSAPGYKRDYQQEARTAKARGDGPRHAARERARREAVQLGMVKPHDGQEIDHKQPLIKGGAGTDPKNLRVETPHENRSFPRKPDGGMK
jgi:hypothetical protein